MYYLDIFFSSFNSETLSALNSKIKNQSETIKKLESEKLTCLANVNQTKDNLQAEIKKLKADKQTFTVSINNQSSEINKLKADYEKCVSTMERNITTQVKLR